MNCHDTGRLLGAYMDDELGPTEAAAIRDHLDACVTCRQQLAHLESVGRLVRSIPTYPAPARLRLKVMTAPKRTRVTPMFLAWAAAATLAVSLGGALVSRTWRTTHATPVLAEDVVRGHIRALMEGRLVDIQSSNQHTVKPWFQGKLDFSPPVADLSSVGFPLIGGRVDAIGGRPVAALVYQRREHVIDVFVWPASDHTTREGTPSIRGFQERHWVHADMLLWAVSDLNDEELREFARLMQSLSP
jgi:anti-sigma factor RsiW